MEAERLRAEAESDQQQQQQQQQQLSSARANTPLRDSDPEADNVDPNTLHVLQPVRQRFAYSQQDPPANAIADSEPHEVKFLGIQEIPDSLSDRTSAQTAEWAVRRLRKVTNRKKLRRDISKWLELVVSSRRRCVAALPIEGEVGDEGRGFLQSLLEVMAVGDFGPYLCYVIGQHRAGERRYVRFAVAFECESPWASRYLSREMIKSCHIVFEDHKQRLAQAATQRAKPRRKEPRTPAQHAADLELRRAYSILENAGKLSEKHPLPASPTHRRPPRDRGDGLYRVCCRTLGKCKCKQNQADHSGRQPPTAVRDVDLTAGSETDTTGSSTKNPSPLTTSSDASPIRPGGRRTMTVGHVDLESSPLSRRNLVVGDLVSVSGVGRGIVRYIGPSKTDQSVQLAGVELQEQVPESLPQALQAQKPESYFTCRPGFGIMLNMGAEPMIVSQSPSNIHLDLRRLSATADADVTA